MRLRIEFAVDNAAYRDEDNGVVGFAVADTVREVAAFIESGVPVDGGAIVDRNGNAVGLWAYVQTAAEEAAEL